jgi:hypothetical protein
MCAQVDLATLLNCAPTAGYMLDTPSRQEYLAPELQRGGGATRSTPATDVFSVGTLIQRVIIRYLAHPMPGSASIMGERIALETQCAIAIPHAGFTPAADPLFHRNARTARHLAIWRIRCLTLHRSW